jgi:hypothetical protein
LGDASLNGLLKRFFLGGVLKLASFKSLIPKHRHIRSFKFLLSRGETSPVYLTFSVVEHIPELVETFLEVLEHIPELLEPFLELVEHIPELVETFLELVEHIPELVEHIPELLETILELVEHIPELVETFPELFARSLVPTRLRLHSLLVLTRLRLHSL